MVEPKNARRIRPNMPHYGVLPAATDGMLTWDWVEHQMTEARNYWVCTVRADGPPHCVPVWGAWISGCFFFGTDTNSVKAANIRRDNRVVIHLESGDDTVIFEGALVEANPSTALQETLGTTFVSKYGFDPELDGSDVLMYRIVPNKVMAWLESDYPATATYWLFDED